MTESPAAERPRARCAGTSPGSGEAVRQRSIILTQMGLTAILMITVLLGLVTDDADALPAFFLAGALLSLGVSTSAAVLPWCRLHPRWSLVLPLLNFLVVGLVRFGAGETLSGVGLLAALPAVWIGASHLGTASAVALTFGATAVLVSLPPILRAAPVLGGGIVGLVLLPVVLTGLTWFVSSLTKENRRSQEAVLVSERALRRSVQDVRMRERLLRTVLETVRVGLLVVDPDGHDTLMNARQRELHNTAAPEDNADPDESQLLLYGPDRVSALTPAERPVHRAISGEDLEDVQIWAGDPPAQRAISVSSRSMRDDDGSLAGTVVSFNDITDLMLALQSKDHFLSNISHEFRTPLTSILGYLDVTLELGGELPEEAVGYLEIARRNAMRLERLVEDFLAINAGTFEVRPVPTDVGAVLADAAASSLVRANRAGITLTNRAPASLSAVVDGERIGQVVDNLLSNAVKYNRPGGDVTLDASMDDGELRITVEDTGIGIAPEELQQVFDRFFRSASIRSSATGVGLGLLITRSIISEHHGSISVTSELGVGTRFSIALPQ
ncbi:sensor histidine kinase [Arthrobacter echini]|uniref:sensor histidine kinase n=1 Tax=Arthrobacter echini TaxID=1529066 RepID=UPI0014561EF2|nr:ATP-binding protein [Arthrobacter echini]